MEGKLFHPQKLLLAGLAVCLMCMLLSPISKAASFVKQSDTTVSITSQKKGWVQKNGSWYFYDKNGRLCCGSIYYQGNYYYSRKNGKRATGMLIRDGKRYYYAKSTGIMYQKKWLTKNGKTYYFKNSGEAVTSAWLTKGGKKYYFDKNSVMVTGSKKINGSRYYFSKKGVMYSGKWRTTKSGKKYYYKKNGKAITSAWLTKGGKKYYFDKNSVMVTGSKKINGSRYYFSKKGVMYSGKWRTTKSGKKYYYKKNGKAVTSAWLTKGGKKYYFNSNSVMVTGWKKIDGYYYYFDSKGVMAKSKWVGIYYVNSKGRRTSKTRVVTNTNSAKTKYTYESSTLNITLNKKTKNGVSYWLAQVKTSSGSQLKSALSYGTYGGKRQTTSSAVSSNGGVIGINGSAFDYSTGNPSPLGMCIKNGKIYADYTTSYSVMAVKNDGTIYTPAQGLSGKDLLAAGVKDTYNFGPVLIDNGVAQPSIAETAKKYPRSAVGMVKKNSYILLVTNTGDYSGLNHSELVSIFSSYGCKYAYNLDGGGSATLYYNGQVMNKLIEGTQRPCADFLYFTR